MTEAERLRINAINTLYELEQNVSKAERTADAAQESIANVIRELEGLLQGVLAASTGSVGSYQCSGAVTGAIGKCNRARTLVGGAYTGYAGPQGMSLKVLGEIEKRNNKVYNIKQGYTASGGGLIQVGPEIGGAKAQLEYRMEELRATQKALEAAFVHGIVGQSEDLSLSAFKYAFLQQRLSYWLLHIESFEKHLSYVAQRYNDEQTEAIARACCIPS